MICTTERFSSELWLTWRRSAAAAAVSARGLRDPSSGPKRPGPWAEPSEAGERAVPAAPAAAAARCRRLLRRRDLIPAIPSLVTPHIDSCNILCHLSNDACGNLDNFPSCISSPLKGVTLFFLQIGLRVLFWLLTKGVVGRFPNTNGLEEGILKTSSLVPL
ncbi:Hypothetical predicted protein [Podarcis lilfordi]|uniref:Uncharacterized protein n=1 Tax=Podarcis lilfordi TaxID=74358 RepID=A0AA35P618_9SAUR|nr:Hypothetical predicted protein [Podarcis lilfordi]